MGPRAVARRAHWWSTVHRVPVGVSGAGRAGAPGAPASTASGSWVVPGTTIPDPRRTVLVVEDEPSVAEAIAVLLRGDGFRVAVTATGTEGLEAFRARPPDLILLDLMLPGINGLEVCRAVRRTSTVPIIMVTARAGEAEKVVGLEAGADDYLTKPFSIAELRARIRALLRRTDPAG